MNPNRIVFTCLAIAVLTPVFTVGVQADDEGEGPRCNPAGVWFVFPDGEPPYRLVSILPVDSEKKRYIIDSVSHDPVDTPFRGEMVRVEKNVYKRWGTKYKLRPSGDYRYIVTSGFWSMIDCDTAESEILHSVYNKDPFHDDSAVLLTSSPRLNLWLRMPEVDDSSDF